MSPLAPALVVMFSMNIAFAAIVVLLRVRNNVRARRSARRSAIWQPGLLALAAGSVTPEELRARVSPSDTRKILGLAARFARRLRGPDRERIEAFASPLLIPLVADLGSSSADVRARTVQLISDLGMTRHAASVIRSLDDETIQVSMVAARALLSLRYPAFVREVLERLPRYERWSRSLIASMVASAGADVAPELRTYLADSARTPESRAVVAQSLAILLDPRAADPAAKALGEGERELIVSCLRLLAVVGRVEHLAAVRPFLSHGNFIVRAEAVSTVGRLAEPSDIPDLERAVSDPSPWVAIRAARALRELGEKNRLVVVAAGTGPGSVAAAEALASVGT